MDELARQVAAERFQIIETNCKELRFSFSRCDVILDLILINDKELECIDDAKILGLRISSNLKWNNHISDIIKMVNSLLYFEKVKICIRLVTEYACPVYRDSLPQYLYSDIESYQERSLHTIFSQCSYQEALGKAGISTLYERHENSIVKVFKEVCNDQNHKLYHLLQSPNQCNVNLEESAPFQTTN